GAPGSLEVLVLYRHLYLTHVVQQIPECEKAIENIEMHNAAEPYRDSGGVKGHEREPTNPDNRQQDKQRDPARVPVGADAPEQQLDLPQRSTDQTHGVESIHRITNHQIDRDGNG